MRRVNFFRLFLLVLAANQLDCATVPFVNIDRWEVEGYRISIKNIPEHRITAFEMEIVVDAPTWRVWNLAPDLQQVFQMSPRYRLTEAPIVTRGTMLKTNHLSAAWYLPSVTSVTLGRPLPDQLGWEDQCIAGIPEECYMKYTIAPYNGSDKSAVKINGYLKRPWWVSFSVSSQLLSDIARPIASGISYLLRQPKYNKPDPAFPWDELNVYAKSQFQSFKEEGPPVDNRDKPKLALQQMSVYGESDTRSVIGKIAGDYLAYAVEKTAAFDIITSEDLNIMMRYLGARWALLCEKNDECQLGLAEMAKAKYVLSGDITLSSGQYHLNLVLLDRTVRKAAWQFNRPVGSDPTELKSAMNEAAVSLSSITQSSQMP